MNSVIAAVLGFFVGFVISVIYCAVFALGWWWKYADKRQ